MNSYVASKWKSLVILSLLLTFALCAPFTASAEAQQSVIVGDPYAVEIDHDGQFTDVYRLYVDDVVIASLPVTARTAAGVVRFENVVFKARGAVSVRVSAVNADHEVSTAPVALTAELPAPTVPSVPRIIRITTTTDAEIAADGTLRVVASNTRTEVIDK